MSKESGFFSIEDERDKSEGVKEKVMEPNSRSADRPKVKTKNAAEKSDKKKSGSTKSLDKDEGSELFKESRKKAKAVDRSSKKAKTKKDKESKGEPLLTTNPPLPSANQILQFTLKRLKEIKGEYSSDITGEKNRPESLNFDTITEENIRPESLNFETVNTDENLFPDMLKVLKAEKYFLHPKNEGLKVYQEEAVFPGEFEEPLRSSEEIVLMPDRLVFFCGSSSKDYKLLGPKDGRSISKRDEKSKSELRGSAMKGSKSKKAKNSDSNQENILDPEGKPSTSTEEMKSKSVLEDLAKKSGKLKKNKKLDSKQENILDLEDKPLTSTEETKSKPVLKDSAENSRKSKKTKNYDSKKNKNLEPQTMSNNLSINSEESKKPNLDLNFISPTERSYNYISSSEVLSEKPKIETQFGIGSEVENITTTIDFSEEKLTEI